jgi:hypothetical protein
MDCPHVKIARLELWAGVSSALGSRTSGCAHYLLTAHSTSADVSVPRLAGFSLIT